MSSEAPGMTTAANMATEKTSVKNMLGPKGNDRGESAGVRRGVQDASSTQDLATSLNMATSAAITTGTGTSTLNANHHVPDITGAETWRRTANDQITERNAVHEVFCLPELLESILRNLSARALFKLRRVNKTFYDVITSSHSLLCIQFLRPVYPRGDTPVIPQLNPFLTRDTSPALNDDRYIHVNGNNYQLCDPAKGNATNPLPVIEKDDGGIWHLFLIVRRCRPLPKDPTPATSVPAHMYLSQPVCNVHLQVEKLEVPYEVTVKGGTLRQILEAWESPSMGHVWTGEGI